MKSGEAQTTTEPEQKSTTPLEHGHTSAQEQENKLQSGKILEIKPVEGTPFSIVVIEQGTFISLGNQRISQIMKEEESKLQIYRKDWNLIISLIVMITERVYEQIKLEDKARNELPELIKDIQAATKKIAERNK